MLHTIFTKASIAGAAFCLLLSSAQAGNQSTSNWQIVAPEGAGFSVLMPGTPKVEDEHGTSKAGQPVVTHTFTYTSPDKRETYFAGYSEYTTSLLVDETLANLRSGEIGNGRVLWEQATSLNGYPGKKVAVLAGGHVTITEFYVAGARIYMAHFETNNPVAAAMNAAPFLGSLRLGQ